ncbi:MAG: DUF6438 domain-containing protein [Bacteroidota bacterium]
MKNKIYIAILIIWIFTFSCSIIKNISGNDVVISMKKTSCMGNCPVYEISIHENRSVKLHAKENIGMEGQYRSKLSKQRYNNLVSAFESGKFFSFENTYTSRIFKDLPTTYIYFSHEGENKKIKDYYGAPKELKELEKRVARLIDELEWKKVKK